MLFSYTHLPDRPDEPEVLALASELNHRPCCGILPEMQAIFIAMQAAPSLFCLGPVLPAADVVLGSIRGLLGTRADSTGRWKLGDPSPEMGSP